MNPLFPIPNIVLLFVLLGGAASWLAWKSAVACGGWSRVAIAMLRFGAVLALAIPLLNPGEWSVPAVEGNSVRAILVDASASMTWENTNGQARRDIARTTQAALVAEAERVGMPVRIFPFADGLIAPGSDSGESPTDIAKAVSEVVDQFPPGGATLRGVVVISDGRQVAATPLEKAVVRCRAAQVPVNVVPVGEPVLVPDVEIDVPRRHVTAFRGQSIPLTVRVAAAHLPPSEIRVSARLNENQDDGSALEARTVQVAPGRPAAAEFELVDLAPGYHEVTFHVDGIPGERETTNNLAKVSVQVLADAVRVLLVEGSPYWDTKFIAQLLQRERNYRFEVVYRLSDERFFSLEGEEGKQGDSPDGIGRATFPGSADELAAFDLVVFGRNVDPFLDPERVRILREWIETRGGALVLARGNPLTTAMPSLEEVFPADWDDSWSTPFRWLPTAAGEDVGLFGGALPGVADEIWLELPPLQEARFGQRLAPFTQVLAEGRSLNTGDANGRFPAVLSRRVGEGLVISVNTEDLWRWDFFPEVAEAGRIYREFWFQLFHWAVAYSEFLPGKDFALRLSHARVQVGQPVRVRVLRRPGTQPTAEPVLHLLQDGRRIRTVQPTKRSERDGAWEAMVNEDEAGLFTVALDVAGSGPEAELFGSLRVLPKPSEAGLPDPDPEFLERLARATGGTLHHPDHLTGILGDSAGATGSEDGPQEWRSAWKDWPWIPVFLGCFVLEWVIRRRNGLI